MTAIVDADGRVAGLFTDGDLRRTLEKHEDIRGLKVADVMTRNPRAIGPARLAAEAAQVMQAHHVSGRLLVVDDDGRLVGAVHVDDLLRAGRHLTPMPDAIARARARTPRPLRRRRRAHRRAPLLRPRGRGDEGLQHPRRARPEDARALRAWPRACSPGGTRRPRPRGRGSWACAHVILGVEDKLAHFEALRAQLGLDASQCAFVGDDLPDARRARRAAGWRSPSRTPCPR